MDKIKFDIEKVGQAVAWVLLTEERDQRRDPVNTVMNI
jgi:hypothetical protein